MITEPQEELAALYAFGLLEGGEKASFESALAESAELRTLVAQLVQSTPALALSAPQIQPPAGLKDRILGNCAALRPMENEPGLASLLAYRPLRPFVPWAAAAILALTTAWLTQQFVTLRNENASLRTERQLAEVAYHMAQNQLSERSILAEKMISSLGEKLRHSEDLARLKVTALASLAGNTSEAQVIAVWDPEQQNGLLTMEKLPAIADTQDYQIWVVDPAYPNPVDGGVFHVGRDGRIVLPFKPAQPVAHAAAFAISLEKKGGVPKAEGPIVLLGK
jgi:anti-sigma-K factor RskA